MKRIQTRIFRIGGVWQIGFPGLTKVEVENLKSLRGFRYNSFMKMWHVAFHVSTVNYLNNIFDGIFEFLPDPRPRSEAPNISENFRQLTAWISLEPTSDRLILRHEYNNKLYSSLVSMEGGIYDRTNRNWVLSIEKHYEKVRNLLSEFKYQVIEHCISEKTEEKPPGAGHSEESIPPEQYIDRFHRDLFLRKRSKRTIDSYTYAMRGFLGHFSGRDLQDITNEEIRNYLHDLVRVNKYAFSTLNIHISAIKTFYKYSFSIDIHQIYIPRPGKSKHLPKILSKEEIQRMIDRCRNVKHRTIIITLYSTAMRREELLNLTVNDLLIDRRQIRIIGKGDKERHVYLSEKLIGHLQQYLKSYKPSHYLFEGAGGQQYSGSSVGNIIKDAARRAGIERNITPHMLRHSFATHMLTAGVSPMHIQKILGHSDIKTTLIYTHLTDKDLSNLPNPLDSMDL